MDNLKLVNGIKKKLEKLVFSKAYLKDLTNFVNSYNAIAAHQDEYFNNDPNQPEIQVRLINRSKKTDWITALIDTGAAYPLAKAKIFESIGVQTIGCREVDQIEEGNILLENYSCGFQMSGVPIGISACFLKLRDSFQYDIVLGAKKHEKLGYIN